jgi:hypothetical protein
MRVTLREREREVETSWGEEGRWCLGQLLKQQTKELLTRMVQWLMMTVQGLLTMIMYELT